jgi:hypothetical protein
MYSTLWGGGVPSQVSMTQSFPAVLAASTQILAQDTNRKYLALQNNSALGINLRINFGAAASVACLKIQPGQTWVPNAVPVDAINAMGEQAGAGANFVANDVSVVVGT